jgi:hypothetical protein
VFVSENLIRNKFIFSRRMGSSILGLLFGVGVCVLDTMLLGGMFRHIG